MIETIIIKKKAAQNKEINLCYLKQRRRKEKEEH